MVPTTLRLGAADPFTGPVGELLVLPDRDLRLQFVCQRVARVERISPVRTRDTNHNRDVTHGQGPVR
jgi:hypothetical protein